MNRKFKRGTIIAIVLAGVLAVSVAGGTSAYAVYYADRGLPNATLAGESVTGMTREEVKTLVEERLSNTDLALTLGDTQRQLKPSEIGVNIDVDATVDAAFAANDGLFSRVSALFNPLEIPVSVQVDEAKAAEAVTGLAAEVGTPAVDAVVALNADKGIFEVTPAQSGMSFDTASLVEAAKTSLATLSSQELTLTVDQVDPVVTTEEAQTVADAANALIAVDVSISTKVSSIAATAADKAAWVSIPSTNEGLGTPVLDPAKVTAWVQAVGEQSNIPMQTGLQSVNASGKVLATVNEGTSGYTVNNLSVVTEQLLGALETQTNYSGTFTYDEVKATYETRVIADGAENLVYPAAPGEKWLDLNLATNSVTAYEGATVVNGPVYIVPGAPGMETPTGTYQIYLKYESQTMRGTNLDGTTYEAPNVQWVSYFTGSIAFHAAPWQSSFGWSGPGGSHGCVNMPTGSAQYIYDWAPIGTTVVSHY